MPEVKLKNLVEILPEVVPAPVVALNVVSIDGQSRAYTSIPRYDLLTQRNIALKEMNEANAAFIDKQEFFVKEQDAEIKKLREIIEQLKIKNVQDKIDLVGENKKMTEKWEMSARQASLAGQQICNYKEEVVRAKAHESAAAYDCEMKIQKIRSLVRNISI